MDSYFFKYLKLNGANSTTSIVLLLMVIFLLILIGSLLFALFNQINKNPSKKSLSISRVRKIKPEGFWKDSPVGIIKN